jgi:hypothetical protein
MTEHQPEARAVCEHFYASHCYRGMSVRLCMTCHEPDWDDLAGQLLSAGRGSEIAASEPEAPALPGVTRWRTPRTMPGVVREAVRLMSGNLAEVAAWVRSNGRECLADGTDLLIGTPGDYIRAIPGEWVVRNPDSFWGFGHDVFPAETFAETYEPAPGPLILPPDEFRAVQVAAAVLGVPASASEPDGPATEATQTPEAIRELEARFREAVAKRGPLTVLPSDRWQERAEAAEAKLAEIAEMCAGDKQVMAIIGADHG